MEQRCSLHFGLLYRSTPISGMDPTFVLFIRSHILAPNVHHVVLLTGKVHSLETSSNVSCECTHKGLKSRIWISIERAIFEYEFLLKERFLNTSFYWKSGLWIWVSSERAVFEYEFLLKEQFFNTSFYWDWFHILEMHLPWHAWLYGASGWIDSMQLDKSSLVMLHILLPFDMFCTSL
jgi:hypothetical protein